MINIYDILLNFNKKIINFYEWEENDNIKYVKKIPLIKINTTLLNSIIYDEIEIDNKFLLQIENKVEFYDEENKEYKNSIILSDGHKAIAYSFHNKEISSLLLEEENEAIRLANKLETTIIKYKIIKENKKTIELLTRKEQKIKEELKKEIKYLYKNNKMEKLNYYYYEYFNEISNDKEKVYNRLTKSLNKITDKHIYLYKLIQLINNK